MPEQLHAVVHEEKCPGERRRDRQADVDRRADRTEEHEADDRRQRDAEEQRELHLVDVLTDEQRVIDRHVHLDAGGERAPEFREFLFDVLAYRNEVAADRFANAHRYGRLPVVTCDAAFVFGAILDRRDEVAEVNRLAVPASEEDAFELVDAIRFAHRPHVELDTAARDRPGGQFLMLAEDGRADFCRGQIIRPHAVRIEPDSHVSCS